MQNGFILQYLAIFCNRIGRLSFPRGLYKIVNSGRRKLQYLAGTLEHLYYSIWQEHWNINITVSGRNTGTSILQYLTGTLEHLYYSIWQEHWNIYITVSDRNTGTSILQYLAGTLEHLYYSIWQEQWNIYIFKVVISVCLSVYMFVQSSDLHDRLLSWNSVEV